MKTSDKFTIDLSKITIGITNDNGNYSFTLSVPIVNASFKAVADSEKGKTKETAAAEAIPKNHNAEREKAVSKSGKGAEKQPKNAVEMGAGMNCMRMKNYDEAIVQFNKALQIDPKDIIAKDWLYKAKEAKAKLKAGMNEEEEEVVADTAPDPDSFDENPDNDEDTDNF